MIIYITVGIYAVSLLIVFIMEQRIKALKKEVAKLKAENKRITVQADVDSVVSKAKQDLEQEKHNIDIVHEVLKAEIPKDTQELTDEEKISATDITSAFTK